MNKKEIYDLLTEVFHDFEVRIIGKNLFHKIIIGQRVSRGGGFVFDSILEVFTYSQRDIDSSIWYFNVYYNGISKETMIPNKNTIEFMEIYRDILLDILKSKVIINSVESRLRSIGDLETIRDKRIEKIIGDD